MTETPSSSKSTNINNLIPSNGMRFVSSPSDFDGRDAREAERWLIKLNQILKVNKVEDVETTMAIAGSYLKGRALDWWYSVQDQVETFKEFEEMFKKKFMKVIYEKAWRELKAVQQQPDEDVEGISNRLRQLFRAAGVMEDGTKKAIFVASVLPSIGYEMEKVLTMRKKLTFEDLVDEATEHESLVLKYDKKKEAAMYNSNGVHKKAVSFDLESNSMVNSNKDYFSEGSSISSVLSDLVNEMRALKISSVEQRELIQQQQVIIAQHNMAYQQGGGNGQQYQQRSNNYQQQPARPFNDACYNCGEYGHMARACPAPPRRRQPGYSGSGIAGPNQPQGNTTNQMEVHEGGNNGNMEGAGKDLGRQ